MKKPDFILASGCSFTDGGGLDSPTFMKEFGYDTNDNEDAEFELKYKLRWSTLLGNYFNCEVQNISFAGSSNDNIRRNIIRYINSNKKYLDTFDNKICIVQYSFSHRVTHKLYGKHMYSFNAHDKPNFKDGDRLHEWFKTYLELIFNQQEFAEYHYLDLLSLLSYLRENKFTPYVMFFDGEYEPHISNLTEKIMFDGQYFNDFIYEKGERFCDVIGWTKDAHYTPRGNELLSQEIIKHIEKNYK